MSFNYWRFFTALVICMYVTYLAKKKKLCDFFSLFLVLIHRWVGFGSKQICSNKSVQQVAYTNSVKYFSVDLLLLFTHTFFFYKPQLGIKENQCRKHQIYLSFIYYIYNLCLGMRFFLLKISPLLFIWAFIYPQMYRKEWILSNSVI